MSLSALPIALVVPPISLLVPCVVGAFVLGRFRRTGRVLLGIGLTSLVLLSTPIMAHLLTYSLERDLPLTPPPNDPPAAIVILSGDAVRGGGTLEVGMLTLDRERPGAALHRRTKLPVLVTGGLLSGSSTTLGGLMAASLVNDFEIPVRWIEPQAQDTIENARFSAGMLRDSGIRSIYLVTHAWHMQRSVQAFAGTGITVTAAPVRMDIWLGVEASDFIPRTSAWLESYYALHEWIGYAFAAAFPSIGQ